MSAIRDDPVADPRLIVAELRRERDEALARETAMAEVLQVINSSPGDLATVFNAILEKATRICEAVFGVLLTWDGERLHRVAFRGVPTELVEALREPMTPVPGTIADRLVRGERVIATADLREAEYTLSGPGAQALLRHGARSVVHVALHKEERLLGSITVYREEVRPFTTTQIALLQNFAAQAGIAIENARLWTETRESLEQQTATAEVLQVINTSPGDLAPVFDSILDKAHSLCGAAFGSLGIFEGDIWRAVVQRGYGEPLASRLRQGLRGSDNPFLQSLVDGGRLVHIPNLTELDYPIARANVEAGIFTLLVVPLRKDDRLLGTISTARREVRPFSDKQIALLQNFAAQAVIAMENARLLTETHEALEQQTATAEVLQVINSSPGDLAPVFDAILEKAHSLCSIAQGSLELYDGERFRAVAVRGLSDAFADMLRQGYPASDNPVTRPLIEGGRFSYIRDLAETDYSITQSGVELEAVRTLLCVPLRRDDALLGMIASARREVRPFSEKEIALLQNFAAQAVIAIENARLLTRPREALEKQTATAEILRVISSSPTDVQPTFDAIAAAAKSLTGAVLGSVLTYDGERIEVVAWSGWT